MTPSLSFAFTIPLASKTPSAPSSIAFATSFPFFTPAPHKTFTFSSTSLTALTLLLTIPGSAVVTDISPPINSGGSTATKSGESAAIAFDVDTLFEQTM